MESKIYFIPSAGSVTMVSNRICILLQVGVRSIFFVTFATKESQLWLTFQVSALQDATKTQIVLLTLKNIKLILKKKQRIDFKKISRKVQISTIAMFPEENCLFLTLPWMGKM